jgi:hypothetical protein
MTFSSCIPPFAAVILTLEDGAFSTAWRRAMATGFLSLFYLTFLPVVFFPRQPIDAKEPQNDSMPIDDLSVGRSTCMIVRIYTGHDGQTHFEDLPLPAEESHNVALQVGANLVFRCFPADY